MATNAGALSHLVEAASALAEMQPGRKSATTASPSEEHAPAVVKDEDSKTPTEDNLRSKREIFPERLLSILNDTSLSDIITWLPHGRSFVIIRPDVFAEKVMPTYFPSPDARSSTKYPSFTRKLNRWGFRQATRGPDTGAFHHPLFRRDQPQLCLDMVCQRSRNPSKQAKAKQQQAGNVKIAPLTKESLDSILPSTTTQEVKTNGKVATVSVSDETGSEDSRVAKSSNCPGMARLPAIKQGISSDKEFVQRVLKDHEEMERLRIAKVMLYRAYIKALQDAQGNC